MSDTYQTALESLFNSPRIPEQTLLASELGQPLLVSYLRRTSDGEYLSHFGDTFTNILRLSMHNDDISDWVFLPNGWKIKSDIFEINGDVDDAIVLPVVLSTNRILELQKSDTTHPLVLELSVIRYIADSSCILDGHNHRFIIVAFDRLYTDYKSMPTQAITYIEPELLGLDETEQKLIEYTDQLQHYIDSSTLPPKCTKIKWHRRRGKSINMTCQRCPVRNSCPHTNSFTHTNATLDNIIF